MTEEQMRARIIELEEKEKELQTQLTDSQSKYTELEKSFNTEKQMMESRISDLKEYNKELFLKVKTEPQPKPHENNDPTEQTTSIEDVIKSFE